MSALVASKVADLGASKAEVLQRVAAAQQTIQASIAAVVPGGGVVFNEQQQAMFDQQKGMCASQVAQQVRGKKEKLRNKPRCV